MSGCAWNRRALSYIKSYLTSHIFSDSVALRTVRYISVTQSKNMKIVQFTSQEHPNELRVGYLEGDKVVDINKADPSLPSTLLEILRKGCIDKVKTLEPPSTSMLPLSTIMLKAPIHGVDKILCIGLNYKDHCEEQNLTPPKVPMVFSKFSGTIIGPSEAVKIRTEVTKMVDWEVELTVVIGKEGSKIKVEEAFDHVFGYTIAQDISARDWQKEKNNGQFLLGKSMDTFCPLGPWIVTADEISDPQKLHINCSLNGVTKQFSNTNQLIHKIPDIIHRLSTIMTFLPGDIILTGTPGGVGMYRQPPEYLKPGDVLHSGIENIGAFEIRIEEFK